MSGNYFEAKSHVTTYNQFRPTPPQEMIEEVVKFTSQKISGPLELAVDVGCGSGQSTEVFAPYFTKVLGIDSSPSIIREAKAKCMYDNISYRDGLAESLPMIKDGSATLVSVCQSLHWFDIPEFYKEVNRILCKNGALAVYGYELPVPMIDGAKDELRFLVRKYYEDVLGDYVLPESRKVYLENYKSSEFNEVYFIEGGRMLRFDDFACDVYGDLDDLIGYMSSWSTYQNYAKQVGEGKASEILNRFRAEFSALVGDCADAHPKIIIRYNYFLLIGHKA